MIIFLLIVIGILAAGVGCLLMLLQKKTLDLSVAEEFLSLEEARNETLTDQNAKHRGDLSDANVMIELLIREQTQDLKDAHTCLDLLLREMQRA